MKHLTILVPDGQNNLSSVIGPYKIFSMANGHWKKLGGREVFKIQLAGISKQVKLYGGLFSIHPHIQATAIKKTDLIIIPSLSFGDYKSLLKRNSVLTRWIKQQHAKGAEVASICSGAFLLAAAGLVDNRDCSTHWMVKDVFRDMFPDVRLVTDKILTDEQGIYTNGGAFSFLNLLLYLVEKYYDRPTAIYCAKVFQIDIDRTNQSPFTIFTGQKLHGDEIVKKAQALIEKSIDEKISVEQLSSIFSVSRRNFDRRFFKATGNTPFEYQQRVKMEAAKKALESGRKSVNEVMVGVGYSEMKVFREVFKKITGMSPLEYRRKYNKEATV